MENEKQEWSTPELTTLNVTLDTGLSSNSDSLV
jgi:hypothetical protein